VPPEAQAWQLITSKEGAVLEEEVHVRGLSSLCVSAVLRAAAVFPWDVWNRRGWEVTSGCTAEG
jgi:hypothetical protein